ncbi:glycosyltransferase [Cohnella sp. GCM10012308]|uniref:glycosyltransferase n=1 Tax=Cohnella sp. GCM10012308 TaxID=3317329 RepID=UPI00360E353B
MSAIAMQRRITLSMIVKNECGRYLEQALKKHREYISNAVIIDDGSTDRTAEECLRLLEGIPVKLVRNPASRFQNEIELRLQQWEETIRENPEWILNMDADEWFEDRFAGEIHRLLAGEQADVLCFRLYDFWSKEAYRDDEYWQAHHYYRPFLLRYRPDFDYRWRASAQHCGRFPENILELPSAKSELRLKHMGWSSSVDRENKFIRYMLLDPKGEHGWREQYLSIMDEQPSLVAWSD